MRRLTLPLSILTWLGVWAALRFGIQPPIPGQVMNLYMAITTVSIVVYLAADQARSQAFLEPLVRLLREQRLGVPRMLLLGASRSQEMRDRRMSALGDQRKDLRARRVINCRECCYRHLLSDLTTTTPLRNLGGGPESA